MSCVLSFASPSVWETHSTRTHRLRLGYRCAHTSDKTRGATNRHLDVPRCWGIPLKDVTDQIERAN
jgi:hypothetical protein